MRTVRKKAKKAVKLSLDKDLESDVRLYATEAGISISGAFNRFIYLGLLEERRISQDRS